MLRIHFTGADVARTRIASGPDPLWELVLALQMLRPQRGDLLFRGWRGETTDVLRRAGLGPSLTLLLALTPNVGYFPDFLNPIEAARGLEHGLDAIRGTGKRQLRRDVHRLAQSRKLPARADGVAAGDQGMLAELTGTMRTCYDLLVTPYRRSIDKAVDQDRSIRVNSLAAGGVEKLLDGLRPWATWSSGELRVANHRDQDLHLDGRGLLLIPSYFCVTGPLTMLDPELPPVLIYPVERSAETLPTRHHTTPPALNALIGATRAAVLDAIGASPTTTTELARRVGISMASASEHTAVLRQCGLVTSYRDRNRMLHQLTVLGLALLDPGRARR